ncbi:hypothetical protein NWE55_15690 [Myroides albus]|uniref:hypothetical protein n=1 Tax=Myroides albus TaxID=2562892 RepID=UPI002159820E|nr:hypothetical protein [Myroides albus]UVD79545.1 hypothetical protein NWE55_15690 [Myroides albus]
MKKIMLFVSVAMLSLSCSKSDDNNTAVDPIFDAEFVQIKSVNEIPVATLKYAGNKVGQRPVGIVEEGGANCKELDRLIVPEDRKVLEYGNFVKVYENNSEGSCKLKWDYLRQIELRSNSSGDMSAKVTQRYNRPATKEELELDPKIKFYVETTNEYSGKIEIGFQAGYLRIEDTNLSDVTEGSQNKGKSYLYFHLPK